MKNWESVKSNSQRDSVYIKHSRDQSYSSTMKAFLKLPDSDSDEYDIPEIEVID